MKKWTKSVVIEVKQYWVLGFNRFLYFFICSFSRRSSVSLKLIMVYFKTEDVVYK